MDGYPNGIWGKFDVTGPRWHPLVDHCADVAACLAGLLAVPAIGRRLSRLGGLPGLDATQRARLTALAFLHDVGKLNPGFQAKVLPAAERKSAGVQGSSGHSREAVGLLCHAPIAAEAHRTLGLQAMATWGPEGAAEALLLASLSHHGTPLSTDLSAQETNGFGWRKMGPFDPLAGLADLMTACRRWLPAAYAPGGAPLPGQPAFQHAFAGLVMLADWLGSNQAWFPYSEPGGPDRWDFAQERAAAVVARIGLEPAPLRTQVREQGAGFTRLFPGWEPNPLQVAVAQDEPDDESSLLLIESETGSGKTEAVLHHFLRLFAAGRVDGLYFALPTRTAATQLHGRVDVAVRNAFGDAAPPVVLAVPGYADPRTGDGVALVEPSHLWHDDAQHAARERYWAAERPKRFLAAPVAVGTLDQALLSVLRVRHAHLRSAALLRSLLVVDEVHASDPYMEGLVRLLVAQQRRAGGHVALMSATLGRRAHAAYLDQPVPALAEARLTPYPQVTHHPAGVPVRVRSDRPRSVTLQCEALLADPPAIAARALALARQGGRVLVLRNTVRGAVAVQAALEAEAGQDSPLLFRCAGVPTLHHARYAREDRLLLDAAVQAWCGRGAAPVPGVLVATQTIEQSLDVDFDVLLSDLCPMDVLLQRIGRLHRHVRERPTDFGSTVCHVLTPDPVEGLASYLARSADGLGSVYPDLRVLAATWQVLSQRETLHIPADCRALVEDTTHPEALAAVVAHQDEAWQRHAQEMDGLRSAHDQIARFSALDFTVPFSDPVNRIGAALEARITTRLGADDREVRFADGVPGPFGQPAYRLRIPGHLCRGVPVEATPQVRHTEPDVAFTLGERSFRYDRLGLRAETSDETKP